MQQHRIISLASILVMLLIPVIGWFLVAQPQLAAADSADQQRAETEAQNVQSTALVAQLKADSAKLPELNDELNKLRTSIPAGVDSSGYLDGLAALAEGAGVKITNLTVADPVAYTPAVPAADPAAAGGSPTPNPSDTAAPTPPPVTDPSIVTNPLIDSSDFLAIEVSVQVEGTYKQALSFVHGVQSSPRLFLVTKMSIDEDEQSGKFIGVTNGYIYAIPTGVAGKPRPISTQVKQMDPVSTETPDPNSTETPDPDATTKP